MITLVEIDALDAAGQLRTLRFGSRAYQTRPDDDPPNAVFRSRLKDPGNYERHLFSQGRTYGEAQVAAGEVVLVNTDAQLDFMEGFALDGRELRIFSLPRITSRWASRETLLVATMEQASFTGREISIRIRDRLEVLREPIQTAVYAGTTVNGGLTVAEGNADLKDVKKAQLWGTALVVSPVIMDQFDHVYHFGTNALSRVWDVRESGVLLTATQDYPTLAALKAASLQIGQYATCLALAYLRTARRPDGTLTANVSEGASLADRSAARIVRRMLAARAPVVEADFDALHAAQPAECGLWSGTNDGTVLASASAILASIGGFLTGDRLGRLRVGRLLLPAGEPTAVLTRNRIIDRGDGFSRLPTNDPGDGVLAWRVTVRYGRAHTTFSEQDLKNVKSDDAFRALAGQEFRQVVREDPAVKARHPRAADLTFTLGLVHEADAARECERLLATYRLGLGLFEVVQASSTISRVDLNDVVTLKLPRLGLDAGRAVRVLGVTPTLKSRLTTLEVWG